MTENTLLAAAILALGCAEAPLIASDVEAVLNKPISMVILPRTSLAVVASANVNLDMESGSLLALDLDRRELLPDTVTAIPSFAGRMWFDDESSRLFVSDRGHDAVLVFSVAVPGEGGRAVTFEPVDVPSPAPLTVNGVATDEGPYDILVLPSGGIGPSMFVSNAESGSISVIPLSTLSPKDLNPLEPDLRGLPLFSAANFLNRDRFPGRGANRLTPFRGGELFFVTSTATDDVYVIDALDRGVEAVLDLSALSPFPGTRGLAIDGDDRAYIAHRGLDGVLVLDVSGIEDDGLDHTVVDVPFLDYLWTGRGPEAVVFSSDGERLFVSNGIDNTVTMIDRRAGRTLTDTSVSGRLPGDLVLDSDRGFVYVLNFLSNNISVLDELTGEELWTIP